MPSMTNKAKERLVVQVYSHAEGVDSSKPFVQPASTMSNRFIAASARNLDWDVRHLDVDQALI